MGRQQVHPVLVQLVRPHLRRRIDRRERLLSPQLAFRTRLTWSGTDRFLRLYPERRPDHCAGQCGAHAARSAERDHFGDDAVLPRRDRLGQSDFHSFAPGQLLTIDPCYRSRLCALRRP